MGQSDWCDGIRRQGGRSTCANASSCWGGTVQKCVPRPKWASTDPLAVWSITRGRRMGPTNDDARRAQGREEEGYDDDPVLPRPNSQQQATRVDAGGDGNQRAEPSDDAADDDVGLERDIVLGVVNREAGRVCRGRRWCRRRRARGRRRGRGRWARHADADAEGPASPMGQQSTPP